MPEGRTGICFSPSKTAAPWQNPVATGYLLERVIEVRSGLEGGETVILSPSDELENGAKLEVQP